MNESRLSHRHGDRDASDRLRPARHGITRPQWAFLAGVPFCLLVVAAVAGGVFWRPAAPGLSGGNGSAAQAEDDEDTPGAAPDSFPEPAFSPNATPEDLKREANHVAARLAGELPNEPAALDMRARVEVGFGNSAEAVKLWQNCLSLNRDFAPAYHGLGYVAKRKGDFDAAVTMFRKATAIDSQNRKFLTDLVEVLMEAGRMREAVEELKRLMESGPMTPAAALRLGQASLELDDFETARRAFEATLRAEPGERQAHFGLAKIHTRLGNPEKARFHTSEFQRLAARDRVRGGERNRDFAGMPVAREIAVRAHNETADFYEQHGRLVEAEDLWRRAAVLDPANVECRMRLLSLYEGAHRERKALRVCEQLRDLEPARADHWLNVGLLNARLDNVDAGLAAIQKAIDLDPDNPRYRQAYEAVKKAQ